VALKVEGPSQLKAYELRSKRGRFKEHGERRPHSCVDSSVAVFHSAIVGTSAGLLVHGSGIGKSDRCGNDSYHCTTNDSWIDPATDICLWRSTLVAGFTLYAVHGTFGFSRIFGKIKKTTFVVCSLEYLLPFLSVSAWFPSLLLDT